MTKGDLEEKAGQIQQLHNKAEELSLNNEYQLRLKDMNYKEKIKEVSDKFTNELENDRTRYEALLDEKRDMEGEYEEKLLVAQSAKLQEYQAACVAVWAEDADRRSWADRARWVR